jgi:hypothetical protein
LATDGEYNGRNPIIVIIAMVVIPSDRAFEKVARFAVRKRSGPRIAHLADCQNPLSRNHQDQ